MYVRCHSDQAAAKPQCNVGCKAVAAWVVGAHGERQPRF